MDLQRLLVDQIEDPARSSDNDVRLIVDSFWHLTFLVCTAYVTDDTDFSGAFEMSWVAVWYNCSANLTTRWSDDNLNFLIFCWIDGIDQRQQETRLLPAPVCDWPMTPFTSPNDRDNLFLDYLSVLEIQFADCLQQKWLQLKVFKFHVYTSCFLRVFVSTIITHPEGLTFNYNKNVKYIHKFNS